MSSYVLGMLGIDINFVVWLQAEFSFVCNLVYSYHIDNYAMFEEISQLNVSLNVSFKSMSSKRLSENCF